MGIDHYLGSYGTEDSKADYDRLIGEWFAAGRPTRKLPTPAAGLTITELAAAFWKHAKGYYVKNGKRTDEQAGIKIALRFLKQGYGPTRVIDFGPLSLKAIQGRMVEAGHSRSYINHNIDRIKRCFKWGVAQELAPVAVYQALLTVPGLHRGKTAAREPDAIGPVDKGAFQAALGFMPKALADMVRLHRVLGYRPGELCAMQPGDVDTSAAVWC
jgi:integrase